MIVFRSRLFANCVAVMSEIYMKGYMEKLDKIAEMGGGYVKGQLHCNCPFRENFG